MATKLELIAFARTHGIHYSGLSKAQLSDRIRQAGYDPDDPNSSERNEMSDQNDTVERDETPPGPDPAYASAPAQTTTEGEDVEAAESAAPPITGSMYHGPHQANTNFDPSIHHNIDPDTGQSPEEEAFAEWHGAAHSEFEAQRDELGPQGLETPAQTQEREQAAHEEAVEAKRERSESQTESTTESTTTERPVS